MSRKNPFVNCKSRKRKKQGPKPRDPAEPAPEPKEKKFCPRFFVRYDNTLIGYDTTWVCKMCMCVVLNINQVKPHEEKCKNKWNKWREENQKKMNEITNYICEICNKVFNRKVVYKKHFEEHKPKCNGSESDDSDQYCSQTKSVRNSSSSVKIKREPTQNDSNKDGLYKNIKKISTKDGSRKNLSLQTQTKTELTSRPNTDYLYENISTPGPSGVVFKRPSAKPSTITNASSTNVLYENISTPGPSKVSFKRPFAKPSTITNASNTNVSTPGPSKVSFKHNFAKPFTITNASITDVLYKNILTPKPSKVAFESTFAKPSTITNASSTNILYENISTPGPSGTAFKITSAKPFTTTNALSTNGPYINISTPGPSRVAQEFKYDPTTLEYQSRALGKNDVYNTISTGSGEVVFLRPAAQQSIINASSTNDLYKNILNIKHSGLELLPVICHEATNDLTMNGKKTGSIENESIIKYEPLSELLKEDILSSPSTSSEDDVLIL